MILPMHSVGPCLQSTPSFSVGVPMYDNVKLTFSFTRIIAGSTKSLRQSLASGHLLIMCASRGTSSESVDTEMLGVGVDDCCREGSGTNIVAYEDTTWLQNTM